jgi:beta-xylosidase
MKWVNDWPVIGVDADGDGVGEPVLSYQKPNVGKDYPISTVPDSDEFNQNRLGPQWQWQANPKTNWAFPSGALGFLRLFNVPLPDGFRNFWDVPNLLLQKFPAPVFTATTKVTFTPRTDDEETGLIVMGLDYVLISVKKRPEGLFLSQTVCKNAESGANAKASKGVLLKSPTFYLRLKVSQNAVCTFSYSADGTNFLPVGEPFNAQKGKWIGAKVGIFAVGTGTTRETGYADFDWFRVE